MSRSLGPDAPIPQQEVSDRRERNDLAASGRFNGPRIRRIFAERKVRSANVIVAAIAFQDSSQMVLVEDQHVV